jgi:glycosyltransferase involved in cell wall biosynthesis
VNILLVTQYFWPESFRVNDLVSAWKTRGHDVAVLTGLPNYPAGRLFPGYTWRGPYRETYAGAAVRRVPLLTRGPRRGLRLILNYLSFVPSAALVGLFAPARRPDIIIVYVPSPITACIPAIVHKWRWKTPLALWVQDLWPDNLRGTGAVRSPRLLRAAGAMTRWIYRRCDLVLVQSPAFIDAVRRVCPNVGPIEVLPNWADAFYRPQLVEPDAPERKEWPEGFTIVFAGNLGSAQGLGIVLDAAEMLERDGLRCSWVFIGEGNDRERLERESRQRGLDPVVRFLGWRQAEAMPRYLSLADVLLVSLRRGPGFVSTIPSKLQSSLAMGRPILAAIEGEGARVVRDAEAGVVVEPENPAALAAGARALHEAGADAREAMGRRGRDYASRHFDRDTLVMRLDDWMRGLVEKGS